MEFKFTYPLQITDEVIIVDGKLINTILHACKLKVSILSIRNVLGTGTKARCTYRCIYQIQCAFVFKHHIRCIEKPQAPHQGLARRRTHINLGIEDNCLCAWQRSRISKSCNGGNSRNASCCIRVGYWGRHDGRSGRDWVESLRKVTMMLVATFIARRTAVRHKEFESLRNVPESSAKSWTSWCITEMASRDGLISDRMCG
jgi:hypothetical protein